MNEIADNGGATDSGSTLLGGEDQSVDNHDQGAAVETGAQDQEGVVSAESTDADTTGEPGAEGADGEQPGEIQGAPEQYEQFTLPEGVDVNDDRLASFHEFAKENDWNQEQAQKAIDYFTDIQKQDAEALQSAMENRMAERAKEDIAAIKKMNVMNGGDGFDANVGKAVTGIARAQESVNEIFGDEAIDLRQHLEASGIGNDPALLQMAYAYASTVSEDGFIGSDATGGTVKRDREDILYNS